MKPSWVVVTLCLGILLSTFSVLIHASEIDELMHTLETGPTPEDREQASVALSCYGAAAATALAEALQSDNQSFRADAAYALAQMRDVDLTPVAERLLDAVDDPHWRVRANIAFALGKLRSDGDRAAQSLVEVLDDNDSRVRSAAALSLGELRATEGEVQIVEGEPQVTEIAIESLVGCLDDEERDVRYAATKALGLIGPLAQGAVDAVVELLDDKSAWVREEAARALGQIGAATSEVVQALRAAFYRERERVEVFQKRGTSPLHSEVGIGSEEAYVCAYIIRALGDLGEPSVPVLTELLSDEVYMEFAANNLTRIGEPSVPALVKAVRSSNQVITRRAALALALINPAPVAALVELSMDGRAAVREAAAYSLGNVRDSVSEVIPPLVDLIGDEDEAVRLSAVKSLGGLNYPEEEMPKAIEGLRRAVDDYSSAVRLEATRVLSRLVAFETDLMPTIVRLSQDSDPKVRKVAMDGLSNVLVDVDASAQAVPALVRGLSDPDGEVKRTAIEAIGIAAYNGRIEDVGMVGPQLTQALKDPYVRDEAISTLACFGPAARPALSAMFDLLWSSGDSEDSLVMAIATIGRGEIVTYVSGVLKDKRASVRMKAVNILMHIGPDARSAVPALEWIAENDPDMMVRFSAQVALDNIK